MEEFLLFFLSVFVFFILINKLFKNGEIVTIKSNIDNSNYVVRKLPDAKLAAEKLAKINQKVEILIDSLDKNRKGVSKLVKNYNPNTLSETGIGAKYTSYSVNKGEKISICIRQTDNSFIKDNTVIFVVIHELAHVMTKEDGHPPIFWENMGYLLKEASNVGVYTPIDYSKNPVNYCGVLVDQTPYPF